MVKYLISIQLDDNAVWIAGIVLVMLYAFYSRLLDYRSRIAAIRAEIEALALNLDHRCTCGVNDEFNDEDEDDEEEEEEDEWKTRKSD